LTADTSSLNHLLTSFRYSDNADASALLEFWRKKNSYGKISLIYGKIWARKARKSSDVLQLWEEMQAAGIQPDTFICNFVLAFEQSQKSKKGPKTTKFSVY